MLGSVFKTAGAQPSVSPGVVRFIGASELGGALGLLLPSLTRIKPGLTSLAGVSLLVVMQLASLHHAMNNEAKVIPINLVLGGLAAFVAWGRWKEAPNRWTYLHRLDRPVVSTTTSLRS